jgi:signal transduction histidine kinase/CheY-like chemotaxis protein/ligand-binding sensor domain-containing protein
MIRAHRIRWILVLLLSLPFQLAADSTVSPRGSPAVQTYEMQNLGGAHMNTQVRQAPDGRLLVANQVGLFRFDGARWQLHKHPDALGGMEYLTLDAQGRIYTSFDGDIGYFAADASDQLNWHSLIERIPEPVRAVSEILMVHFDDAANALWFATPRHLYRLAMSSDREPAQTLAFPGTLHAACVTTNGVLTQSGTHWQLERLNTVAWQLQSVVNAEMLTGQKISSCIRDPLGGTLVVTYPGLLARDIDGAIVALADMRRALGVTQIRDALLLQDGRLALAQSDSGLMLTDRQGGVLDRYGPNDGIPGDRRLNGVFQDRDGDIWLAQERTLAKVALTRAVTRYDAARGLPSANDIERWQGDLYASNTMGLYRLQAHPDAGGEFVRVLPSLTGLRGMAKLDDSTLIVHGASAYAITRSAQQGLIAHSIEIDGLATIVSLVETSQYTAGRVWLGTEKGLFALERQDQNFKSTPVRGVDQPIFKLAETDANTIFIADRLDGVWRIDVDGVRPPQHYSEAEGLPKGQVRIYPGPHRPWFTTMMGLRIYDRDSDRFVVPEGLPAELQQDRLFSAYEDHDRNLWVRGGAIENDVYWRDGDTWRPDHVLFGVFEPFPTIFGFQREGDIGWAVRATGLLRFDLAQHRPMQPPLLPLLTSVIDTRAKAPLPLRQAQLATHQRDLRLEFAMPALHRPDATRYRSRLLGFDSEWSDWGLQDAIQRIYTNLPDGAFELQIEASDSYRRTALLNYPVVIPAPWFRTPLAYAGYALLLLTALLTSARIGSIRRRRHMLTRQRELEATVAERTRALSVSNLQLSEQANRLAEVDRLKTRFFINVGHEFRTPLTLILGPLDDLLQDTREHFSDIARQQLLMVQRNARRVLDLIVELMDVNRLEQGHLHLHPVRVDLLALLRSVTDECADLAARYGHQIQLHSPGIEQASAELDATQIERALSNLIGNAAKYMARGGLIDVTLARDTGREGWLISVRDQGRGIDSAALPHVFDRFFQADGSDRASGYGVGLSLVREIALAHGGDVQVASERGVGSTFVLQLPAMASKGASASGKAATNAQAEPGSQVPVSDIHSGAGIDAPAVSELPIGDRARERVLIVDDHDDMRQRLRQLLAPRFEVLEAADGDQAWQLARDELPDLIVSDVMMPGIDGVELSSRLRGFSETSAIGVLLLTAKVGSAHAVAGLRAGANDYLSKPFDASELLARCDAILAHAHRLRHRLAAAVRSSIVPVSRPDSDAPGTDATLISSHDARWRQRLDMQIAANLHEPAFDVEALAQAMHADRSSLFRHCKERLGVSPSDYLRNARLSAAHQLLENGAGSISEVAYASGFDSLSSFTRAFKARYNLPPSQILKRAAS